MKPKLIMDDKELRARVAVWAFQAPIALEKAVEIGGLSMLNWVNNGSEKNPSTPPIRFGFLRGSGSVFRGSKHLGNFNGAGSNVDPENPPNTTHNDSDMTITIGNNASYATKMHEDDYEPSELSAKTQGGNKWIEKHLMTDKDLLMEVIRKEVKKGAGM